MLVLDDIAAWGAYIVETLKLRRHLQTGNLCGARLRKLRDKPLCARVRLWH
jgi:hypothetical protein